MIKKYLREGLFSLAVIFGMFLAQAQAQNVLELPRYGSYGGVIEENRVLRGVNEVVGTGNFMEAAISSIFSKKNIATLNVVIGMVGIIYFVILGIRFTTSQGQDEELSKAKANFGYIALGLVTVSLGSLVGFTILNPDARVNPGFLANTNVINGFEVIALRIKLYLQVLTGGIALLSILTSSFMLITSGGNEETVNKEKQLFRNFLLAAVIIMGAEILVRGVFFAQGMLDGQQVAVGVREIVGIANILLSMVAALATFMLILSGLYLVTSMGDEERSGRAKKIVIACISAIVLSVSCYSLIRFFF